jgi:hypothetical protein
VDLSDLLGEGTDAGADDDIEVLEVPAPDDDADDAPESTVDAEPAAGEPEPTRTS